MWGQWLRYLSDRLDHSIATSRRGLTNLILTVAMTGCITSGRIETPSPTPSKTPSASPTPTGAPTTDATHPDLAPVLTAVITADDPAQFAKDQGYTVQNGAIEVVVDMRPGTELPRERVVSVVSSYENRYSVFVRFEDLLHLARHDKVTSVRPPAIASTHTND